MADAHKRKAVSVVGSLKTKATDDGERQIVFVASSNGLDRHYENVDVKSLRLPLKGGGEIVARDLPKDGADNIDIPLMLNHSFDVTDVIGSVRRAYLDGDELVFEAGISKREIAQDMLTLIDEGHLNNAFSITMADYDYDTDTNTIYDAEVIEVSLVFRGANKEARLLAIKSLLGGKQVADEKSKITADEAREISEKFDDLLASLVKDEEADTEEEKPEETPEQESKEVEAEAEAEPAAEEPAEEEVKEKDIEPAEAEPEAEPEEQVEEAEEETKEEEKDEEMEKSIAKETIVKAQPAQAVKSSSDYLKSKEALKDFRNVVLKHHRGSNEQIMKEWTENLSSKAISGDAILPSRIENIFFKTWVDNDEVLSTFRQLGVRAGAVYAMTAASNGTAQAHVKGEEKVDQELESVRRDIKALGIYKKLPIDLQDLFDDETGELLAFRVEELAARVAHAIAIGAIIGGYSNNGRGLNPMSADITASADATNNPFAASVASIVTTEATDTELDKAIRVLGAVKGDRKVLIVPEGWRTQIALLKNANGYYLGDPEEILNARIFEFGEMSNSGFEMIAYAEGTYVIAGEANATTRTDFDLTTNQDVMLVERYVGGSATGYKTVAGIVDTSASS